MINEPDLRQLRTFVVVAEELHFAHAAERLSMAQQSLSAQIQRLEQRLGVELFRRTTRRVELTEAGQVLLAHARPLLAAASQTWDEVALAGTGAAGTLLVGYSPTARNEVLPLILDEVGNRYPRLEILASENWAGWDALVQGTIDIALVRFNEPDETRILGTVIRESRVGLLLGRSDPHAGQSRIRLDQMGDRPLEVPARRHSARFRDDLVELLRSHGFAGEIREYHNLTSHFMLDDRQACERIISGATFGFGFEDQYPALPDQLVWIPLEPALYAPMHLCWRDDVTPAMRTFINLTLEISDRLGWVRPEVRSTRPPVPET